MNCKHCNIEFETKDKRRKYCTPLCSRLSRLKPRESIKRNGNITTVSGVVSCYMYGRGLI